MKPRMPCSCRTARAPATKEQPAPVRPARQPRFRRGAASLRQTRSGTGSRTRNHRISPRQQARGRSERISSAGSSTDARSDGRPPRPEPNRLDDGAPAPARAHTNPPRASRAGPFRYPHARAPGSRGESTARASRRPPVRPVTRRWELGRQANVAALTRLARGVFLRRTCGARWRSVFDRESLPPVLVFAALEGPWRRA